MQKFWYIVRFRSWRTYESYVDFDGEILAFDEEDAKKKVIAAGYQFLSAKKGD